MTTGESPGPVDPMAAPGPAAADAVLAVTPVPAAHNAGLLDPRPLRWIVFPLLLMMATFLRFLSLPDRGMFDADQGRDFLVLRSMLVDGIIPLLGPPASIGGIHHGAAYYYSGAAGS